MFEGAVLSFNMLTNTILYLFIYCESTLIHGYKFSWIREETQILAQPRKPIKLVPHRQ